MQPENIPEPGTAEVSGDPGCRVDELLKFLAREWMSHIVWTLGREEAIRFGALRRALPGDVSARVLSRRLKELEAWGSCPGMTPAAFLFALSTG